ncbi:MAG: WD40 repeat domain-containing protein, partial [Lachnospiraceae bacterium]|nr:WD40 repeat domain-containing protein [Lachnospiraceae bacterium]
MDRLLELIRKYKRILITAAAVLAVLIIGFVGFKLLVKVGNPKYFYNYLHDAAGSLEAEYYPEYEAGADSSVPFATMATDPEAHGVTEIVKVSVRKDPAAGEAAGGRSLQDWETSYTRDYVRSAKISFSEEFVTDGMPKNGMLTFRGNYARTGTSVGMSKIDEEKLEKTWTYNTGKILKSNGSDYWSGNGWTGQPILMQWDSDVKQTMNMYDSAKNKDGLVEVIYPGMDGSIRFLDLETGEETRPVIYVGMTFKGTASLYPDGTPLLVCGSGDAQTGMYGENVSQRFYIYSLIDGSLLYQGGYDSGIAPRIWHAYDSSSVIDP